MGSRRGIAGLVIRILDRLAPNGYCWHTLMPRPFLPTWDGGGRYLGDITPAVTCIRCDRHFSGLEIVLAQRSEL